MRYLRWIGGAVSNLTSDLGQQHIAGPGPGPQHSEGRVHPDVQPFGEHSLGLLGHHPTGQRGLQLTGENLALADRALLQDADRGRIGQRSTAASRSTFSAAAPCW